MTSGSSRCAVVNCDISACGKGVTIGGTCLDCEIRGGAIRSCTSTNGAEGGLYAANSQRLRVIGVLITGNASNGVYFGDSPDAEVVGCVITSNGGTTAGRRGIAVAASVSAPRLRIVGNYIAGNAEQAFYCPTGIVDGEFVANRCVSNNAAAVATTAGVEIGGSGWTIASNLIADNLGTGCDGLFIGASNGTITGNLIRGNGRRGIYVFGAGVNDWTISGNTIKNNGISTNAPGIEINGSGGTASGHVVTGNRITDDQGGAATQTFGLTTTAVDRVIYDGNNLFPNKTGATSIAGTNVTAGTNIIA
jgi:parallel beta-helix repeat protein